MEGENTFWDGTVNAGVAQPAAEPVVMPEVVSVAPPPVMPEIVSTAAPVVETVPVAEAAPFAEPIVDAAPVAEAVVDAAPVAEAASFAEPVAEAAAVTTAEVAAESPVLQVQSQSDYFASAFRYEPATPEAAEPVQPAEPARTGTVFTPRTYNNTPSYQGGTGYQGGQTAYGTGYGQGNFNANAGYNQGAENNQSAYNGGRYDPYGSSNVGSGFGTGMTAGGYAAKNNSYAPGYRQSDEYSTPDYYGGVYNNDPFASSYYDDEEMPRRASNGLAIAALVCGIVSLVTMCSYTGFIPGIIAIVLGIKGAAVCDNKAMARTGMILGICGVVAGAIFIFAFILRAVDEIYSIF